MEHNQSMDDKKSGKKLVPGELASHGETTSEVIQDETCGFRASCCSKLVVFSCGICQPLATVKWALALFCISNMLLQTIVNGLISVCISTLEKRFELRSTESGVITSFNDIGQAAGMIFLMFFSKNLDKPRWMGWGAILTGIGSVLFSLPHFIAPMYFFVHEDITNYCGNVTEPDCDQSSIRNYRFVFIVAFVLMGIGICPLYCHCVTYLDENLRKGNSALYNAIFLTVGGLGPAVGFLIGGATLELYTYITIDSNDLIITSNDYSWIGAWWIGFLVCGIILLINAIPILMLPKHLPGTEEHRKNRDVETQKSHLKKNDNTNPAEGGPHRIFSEILLLLRNKPYIFMTMGFTLNSALIYGFNTFGAKYFETVFGLTPFYSALLYGIAAIFASAGAQLTSGFVIKKFDLDVRGILRFAIIAGIVSALCSIGFLVHCDEIDFAGGTVPYLNSESELSISPVATCNQDCGCSTDRYQPVCANGVTYFSPCFAGCEIQINETTYGNCSCIIVANSSFAGGDASSEFCNSKSCNLIIAFVFIIFVCFFTSILTISPAIQVTLRCVPFGSRDIALPLQAFFTRLVGIMPGRILVGFVLDFACVAWSTECGEQGSCKSYRRWEISRNCAFLLIAQTVVCAIFYILVLVTYEPAKGEAGTTSNDIKNQNESSFTTPDKMVTTAGDDEAGTNLLETNSDSVS